jgi:diaminopropionate ammonia-lyase
MIKFRSKHDFSIIRNPNAVIAAPYGAEQAVILNAEGLQAARGEISSWPRYRPTPLVALRGLAQAANVGSLYYKDEGCRFGLASFKPLGGAYAVFRVIEGEIYRSTGQVVCSSDLFAGRHRDLVAGITVCAATDGNHGRSVAWGARMFGCRCVIYINEAVSEGRQKAIAAYGAEVRRVPGSFDDAVRAAKETAAAEDWHLVPDTAAGGNVEASGNVMQGYALLAHEAISQLPDDAQPSHLFVQAGVGGLAAAVCGQFWQAYGEARPITVTVEPHSAACWFESFKAGEPVILSGELDSLMAGLACGEISPLSWPILKPGAHAAMTIPDEAAAETMRLLAAGGGGDQPIVGGESGVAGLAAFLLACQDAEARTHLRLDETSRVVVIGSEGDTDPETYRNIVGRTGDEVRGTHINRGAVD